MMKSSALKSNLTAVSLAAAVLTMPDARAGESLFGYVYTTDLHPKGTWEFEQWATARVGKQQGDYALYQFREEIEYGVTNDFQLAGYINWHRVDAQGTGPNGETIGPFIPENAEPDRRHTAWNFDSGSVEAIYRIWSPYLNFMGLALYLEPTFGPDRREIESKILLQKNFLDDRLVWAANFTNAFEWERQTGDPTADPSLRESGRRWEHAKELEFTTGLSYRFAPSWFAGVEFRNHNEFAGHSLRHPEHSAFFLGPTIHYGGERFWMTLTVLPQLPLAQPYDQEQRDFTVHRRIYGDEHEAVEVRLKAGWTF